MLNNSKGEDDIRGDTVATLAKRLAQAMKSSGYDVEGSAPRLVPVISKLELLADRGNFGRLLGDLLACNNRSNLHASLFEAVFAWHFEVRGKHLLYEEIQQTSGTTTIDFLYTPSEQMRIYFELRLLQQQEAITTLFEEQLRETEYFGTLLDGSDEQREVVRLQRVILEKVQDRNGNPVKFFSAEPPNYNVLVIDVTQPFLGMVDKYDCILACYGDEAVPPLCRRDIFGLFQIPASDASSRFLDISNRCERLRKTIHGILFMRRLRGSNPIDFELQCYFIPNRHLITDKPYQCILAEFASAFSPWNKTNLAT